MASLLVLQSLLFSSLLVVREFVTCWSRFILKRSSVQEEDFQYHCLVVFQNILYFLVKEQSTHYKKGIHKRSEKPMKNFDEEFWMETVSNRFDFKDSVF